MGASSVLLSIPRLGWAERKLVQKYATGSVQSGICCSRKSAEKRISKLHGRTQCSENAIKSVNFQRTDLWFECRPRPRLDSAQGDRRVLKASAGLVPAGPTLRLMLRAFSGQAVNQRYRPGLWWCQYYLFSVKLPNLPCVWNISQGSQIERKTAMKWDHAKLQTRLGLSISQFGMMLELHWRLATSVVFWKGIGYSERLRNILWF